MSQRAVSVATTGLPGPLKSILTSRIGAPLTVMGVLGLMATGVVQFDLLNGRPNVSIDRQRAAEVKQDVVQYVDRVDERLPDALRNRITGESAYGQRAYSDSPPQYPAAAPPSYGNQPGYPPSYPPASYPPAYAVEPSDPAGSPTPRYSGSTRRLTPNSRFTQPR